MLVLPDFELARPRSLAEALGLLAGPPGEAVPIAGGTDLVPALKLGLRTPKRLVSLRGVAELRSVRELDGALHLGAGLTLGELADDQRLRAHAPAVAHAASLVGSPQVRNMGTLGGNLCLDTRCGWYDQTEFWRGALGGCLRTDPVGCYVVPAGKGCVAAFSADTPPPLLARGASVRLCSASGERTLPLAAFYGADGIDNTVRGHDELVVEVIIPAEARRARADYQKLRPRQAIDFPLLGVAVAAWYADGPSSAAGSGADARDGASYAADGTVLERLEVIVTALGAKPRRIGRLDELRSRHLDADAIAYVADRARQQCHPLTNLLGDTAWRRDMVPVFVRRALRAVTPAA